MRSCDIVFAWKIDILEINFLCLSQGLSITYLFGGVRSVKSLSHLNLLITNDSSGAFLNIEQFQMNGKR